MQDDPVGNVVGLLAKVVGGWFVLSAITAVVWGIFRSGSRRDAAAREAWQEQHSAEARESRGADGEGEAREGDNPGHGVRSIKTEPAR